MSWGLLVYQITLDLRCIQNTLQLLTYFPFIHALVKFVIAGTESYGELWASEHETNPSLWNSAGPSNSIHWTWFKIKLYFGVQFNRVNPFEFLYPSPDSFVAETMALQAPEKDHQGCQEEGSEIQEDGSKVHRQAGTSKSVLALNQFLPSSWLSLVQIHIGPIINLLSTRIGHGKDTKLSRPGVETLGSSKGRRYILLGMGVPSDLFTWLGRKLC